MHASRLGEISFLHASQQVVDEDGKWLGSLIDLDATVADVPTPVLQVALEAVQKAAALGWHGVTGLDILHRLLDGEARLVDPNFRWNGSTAFKLLRKVIRARSGRRFLRGVKLRPLAPTPIGEALESLAPLLDDGLLFIVGGAVAGNDNCPPASFQLYAGVTGRDVTEIDETLSLLRQQYAT
jgi:hypothetical protein